MLRVFTAFSGYDSQLMALRRIGVEFDCVGWSEVDKFAIQAHNAVFPEYAERNYGDICRIDWQTVPDFDLFTYSSPCQDFSQAGKQAGGEKNSGTRSSLLWECERAIREKRPKYLLLENVAALVSSKFVRLFNAWQLTLERLGYSNFTQLMNAKNYGVPQNRNRVFMVSILRGEQEPRFEFPKPFALAEDITAKLEEKVPEKYYLKEETVASYILANIKHEQKGNGFKFAPINGGGSECYNNEKRQQENGHLSLYAINTEEGICRTIKAQYQQTSAANFVREDAFGATGVFVWDGHEAT